MSNLNGEFVEIKSGRPPVFMPGRQQRSNQSSRTAKYVRDLKKKTPHEPNKILSTESVKRSTEKRTYVDSNGEDLTSSVPTQKTGPTKFVFGNI